MSDSLVLKCLKIGRSPTDGKTVRWQRPCALSRRPINYLLFACDARAYPTPPAPRRRIFFSRASHTARAAAPQVSRDDLPAIFQKYGDDEFVMDLLEEFVREANTSLAVIETKDDARAVQSAAHRIKGSAGNLDLHSIRQIAEVVEVNAVSDGVEWPYRGGDGGGADEGDGEFDAVVRAARPLPRRARTLPAARRPPLTRRRALRRSCYSRRASSASPTYYSSAPSN